MLTVDKRPRESCALISRTIRNKVVTRTCVTSIATDSVHGQCTSSHNGGTLTAAALESGEWVRSSARCVAQEAPADFVPPSGSETLGERGLCCRKSRILAVYLWDHVVGAPRHVGHHFTAPGPPKAALWHL